MGLDDFEPEGAQEDPPSLAVNPNDEDLFDFPPVQSAAVSAAAREVAPPLPSSPPPESRTPLESVPAAALPQAGSPAKRPYPPYDPILDEDIFHFDELFTPAESRAGDEFLSKAEVLAVTTPAEEPKPAEPAAPVAAPKKEAPRAERGTKAEPSRSTSTPAPQQDVVLGPSAGMAPPKLAVWNGPSSRVLQIALAAVLVVQAAFVFFAWQASQVFRDAVQSAFTFLASSHEPASASAAFPPPTQPQPSVGSAETLSGPGTDDLDEWVARAEGPYDITIRIAERDLEEGEYAAARRMLYGLLANRDRQALPDERAADVLYLIAESWSRESAAMQAREGDER